MNDSDEAGGYIHELYGRPSPALADLASMSKVAEITEHTGILDGAPLAVFVGFVAAMGADKGKDPLEDRGRQLEPGCENAAPLGSVVVMLVMTGIVEAVLVALEIVVGLLLGFLGRLGLRRRLLASTEELHGCEFHAGQATCSRSGCLNWMTRMTPSGSVRGGEGEGRLEF